MRCPFSAVENITGTKFADTITGDSAPSTSSASAVTMSSTLYAGGANDILRTDDGDSQDWLRGGLETDTCTKDPGDRFDPSC